MKQRWLRLVDSENRFAGLKPDDLTEAEAESLTDLALRILAARHRKGQAIESPAQSQAYLRLGWRSVRTRCSGASSWTTSTASLGWRSCSRAPSMARRSIRGWWCSARWR